MHLSNSRVRPTLDSSQLVPRLASPRLALPRYALACVGCDGWVTATTFPLVNILLLSIIDVDAEEASGGHDSHSEGIGGKGREGKEWEESWKWEDSSS
jgi:hypothetical protein